MVEWRMIEALEIFFFGVFWVQSVKIVRSNLFCFDCIKFANLHCRASTRYFRAVLYWRAWRFRFIILYVFYECFVR